MHLCYSMNVFPSYSFEELISVLTNRVSLIKRKFDCNHSRPFGVGLWINNAILKSLQSEKRKNLKNLKQILSRENFYVFSVNAFPFGVFHKQRVKEKVYLPDWTSEERYIYTCGVAEILAELLPENISYGSISTLPGGWFPYCSNEQKVRTIAENLKKTVEFLFNLKERTGKHIKLAVEPEPFCLWETPKLFVDFFYTYLNENFYKEYIGICYDTCHEEIVSPQTGYHLKYLNAADISVVKIQLTAALKIDNSGNQVSNYENDATIICDSATREEEKNNDSHLKSRKCSDVNSDLLKKIVRKYFFDTVYLHQTKILMPIKHQFFGGCIPTRFRVHKNGILFTDIPDALRYGNTSFPWIIHYHMPVYIEETSIPHVRVQKNELDFILETMIKNPEELCPHLEIETYTHNILPGSLRGNSIEESIFKEYRYVLDKVKKNF